MLEDKTNNTGMENQAQPIRVSLQDRAAKFNDFVAKTKAAKLQENQLSNDTSKQNLFVSWLNTDDHSVAEECNRLIRLKNVAEWINSYFYDWQEIINEGEEMSFVQDWLDLNQDNEYGQMAYDYIADDGNVDCDASEFYKNMWWDTPNEYAYESTEEEKVDEEDGSFLWNVFKNYVWWAFNHRWNVINNLLNGTMDEVEQGTVFSPSETDYTSSALENYAAMNYNTNFYGLTDEQKEEARKVIATKEWMDMYKPTAQRVVSQSLEGLLDIAMMTAWRPLQLAYSVWEEIPYVSDVLEWISTLQQLGWYYINKLPLLSQFRESLQTEEEKSERDQFVGSLVLAKLLQRRKGREKWWKPSEVILKELDPMTTIKEFKERFTETPKDIKNVIKEKWKNVIKREKDRTIKQLSKLSERQEQNFIDDFGEPYTEWMNDRNLVTKKDVNEYYDKNAAKKDTAIRSIKWRYKSPEVDPIIEDVVELSKNTNDPLYERFSELKEKYDEGWLEFYEIEEFKKYFQKNRNFNYDNNNYAPEERIKYTNMNNALIKWQREVAKENWFENLEELNKETMAWYELKDKLIDKTQVWKWVRFRDFVIAFLTWKWKTAAMYLFSQNLLNSPTVNKYYLNILKKLSESKTMDELEVNFEKIRSIQDEKAFMEYVRNALPDLGGETNPAWTRPTVDVSAWETFVASPEWDVRLKNDNNWRNGIDFVK